MMPLTPPQSPETYIRPKLSARTAEARRTREESEEDEVDLDEEDLEMMRYLGKKAPGKKESLMGQSAPSSAPDPGPCLRGHGHGPSALCIVGPR